MLSSSSSTLKSSVTATLRRKRDAAEEAKMEREMDWELSLKETEGGRRGVEAGLEMEKGRDLGLKVERARDEAEAAMEEEKRRERER
ncbi:hypothetical protein HID58_009901 [Brassica napus]|uniref:Uncharacterized protein n=1 Tax=Brassica napus TaxID=3708 RepID=A0ABQ8DTV8_BRANA|nr:hypothetical protein HID58_009901 [Brassica napus]